ncbi:MAG: ABC transporter ATP-binding protein [Pseudomonadota bacterium]
MARVTLDKVNKIYPSRHGDVHAVQDLDLAIEDGEFVALLGPSGCGKTSTLRMIVGLEAISGGVIAFDGQPVNDQTPEQRNVAMAFETYALYPTFTVAQNLAFPLEVKGVDKPTRDEKVAEVARLLRIEPILDSFPRQLSGGQQQRVSLGRALIRDPAVFILDEVMSHLDAHLKFQMLFELKRIHQTLERTIVYVTHDQMEALALADRVAVMSDAKLQQFGDRDTLYDRPANTFVAGFIGEPPTNFLEAEVQDDGTTMRLTIRDASAAFVPDGPRAAAIRDQSLKSVIVGIRPQNLHVRHDEGDEQITATVEINEYQGEHSILSLRDGAAEFRAMVPPSVKTGEGETIDLSYRSRDVMVFHPETEVFIS